MCCILILIYDIQTENILQFYSHVNFNFSEFPKHHPLYSNHNKIVLGTFIGEYKSVIHSFVGLRIRSQMYSFHSEDSRDLSEVEVGKHVKKAIKAKEQRFHDYMKCLLENKQTQHTFKSIQSTTYEFQDFTVTIWQIKRCLTDTISFLPYRTDGIKELMDHQQST